jgi:hypothetical protein
MPSSSQIRQSSSLSGAIVVAITVSIIVASSPTYKIFACYLRQLDRRLSRCSHALIDEAYECRN